MTYEYALTVIRDANLDWYENPTGGFVAEMNGITIHISSSSLILSKKFKKLVFVKPIRPLWKEASRLDKLFEEIIKQASQKCLEHITNKYQENLKNELLKQLIDLSD